MQVFRAFRKNFPFRQLLQQNLPLAVIGPPALETRATLFRRLIRSFVAAFLAGLLVDADGVRPTSSLFEGMACNVLSLASFGGAPHSLDELSIVKCVLKSRSSVGPIMQIADKLGVDLAHIDCRLHGPARDRGRVRCNEWDI